MTDLHGRTSSLTEDEARERAALIQVQRYDLDVDLRELLDGDRLLATSTITFTCSRPGAETFLDCSAQITAARLNGTELDVAPPQSDRLWLSGLADHNTLVVSSVQVDTGSGDAMLRTVDPCDGRVYLWTSFQPDGARRAWACFDQPDLKAVHGFRVLAPAQWTVLSNSAPVSVHDDADGARLWHFADTPPLSTYVVVLNAGPFHEIREQRGDHSLGLYCRQSLARFLDRDAEELLRVTEQGLAFFGERFAVPFPQERYDQVFVPNLGGAMENWGCVTWTDAVLWRSEPTYLQRFSVAEILLHEMAHMWFGDLVTMRWWDDLWLNEAFASFAASWAAASATDYADAWAVFAAIDEPLAYQQDMGPASHAIRNPVPDVARAMANFDAITYVKGEAVLAQLMASVGEEAFVSGLRAYFRDHAWGNARLADLTDALAAAAGADLSSWVAGWLDRAGTDTISLVGPTLLISGPDDSEPRSHSLRIGSYARREGALERVGDLTVRTHGPTTYLPDLPEADLHLLNQGDLTFAAVRTDEQSLQTLLAGAALLPEPLDRALAVSTAWSLLERGELASGELLDCVLPVVATERNVGLVEPFLMMALRAAEQWSPPVLQTRRLARLAQVATLRANEPEVRSAALRILAASATTPQHLETLRLAVTQDPHDTELAWRALTRRAALGDHDEAAVATLLERESDPDAAVRVLGVAAARPSQEAKSEAWEAFWRGGAVPSGSPMRQFGRCFWQQSQHELLMGWAHRFLDELGELGAGGLLATGSRVRLMMPPLCDQAWLDRARALADAPGVLPMIRTELLIAGDLLARVLRSRG